LAQRNFTRFQYCLPSVDDRGSSQLLFGSDVSTNGNSTPMRPNEKQFYVTLEGIDINGEHFNSTSTLRKKGIIVDTGTLVTRIRRSFFNIIARNLQKVMEPERLPSPKNARDMLCYEGGNYEVEHTPPITLHFTNLKLEIARSSAFKVYKTWDNDVQEFVSIFCLTIMPTESGSSSNILGAYLQENVQMSFDLQEEKIFMYPRTCARIY
jgi:Xylanase inhibitor C-terminal